MAGYAAVNEAFRYVEEQQTLLDTIVAEKYRQQSDEAGLSKQSTQQNLPSKEPE